MIDLHNAGPLIAEVTRLREEVADLRAIDTTADEFVDALIAAWPAEDGPVPTEPMEAARYGLRRHLRRLREEVAALKADADRLYDATGFDVDGIIAHDEAMDVQVAALKAEVARLAGVAREACDVADRAIEANEILPSTNSERIADLRAAIPTPDPAAFVAALDAYGQWCGTIGASLATGGTPRFLADCERERDTCRAALLALGGVR